MHKRKETMKNQREGKQTTIEHKNRRNAGSRKSAAHRAGSGLQSGVKLQRKAESGKLRTEASRRKSKGSQALITGENKRRGKGTAKSSVPAASSVIHRKDKKRTTQSQRGNIPRKGKTVKYTGWPFRMQKKRKRAQRSLKKLFVELSLTFLIVCLLVGGIGAFLVSVPTVNGYSMTPTLNDQERLVVYKWGQIKRFSLIYFKDPKSGQKMVRRVVGLPGERLEYKGGSLWINGAEIPERFLSTLGELDEGEPATEDFSLQELLEQDAVQEGSYFVLGDNRRYATDSRDFGVVPEEDVIGVVKARIFPLHQMNQF